MENTKSYKVTKGNIVTGADGEKVASAEGADNTVELTAEQAKPLKDAGVIA